MQGFLEVRGWIRLQPSRPIREQRQAATSGPIRRWSEAAAVSANQGSTDFTHTHTPTPPHTHPPHTKTHPDTPTDTQTNTQLDTPAVSPSPQHKVATGPAPARGMDPRETASCEPQAKP